MRQLPHLRLITLTGNKFRRLPDDYFNDKNIASMIHSFLSEVIFIEMGLDWAQIMTLAPALIYVE